MVYSDGRNSTIKLSIIRGLIDRQQQVISLLESRLQESILGGTDGGTNAAGQQRDLSIAGVVNQIAGIYNDSTDGTNNEYGYTYDVYKGFTGAIQRGLREQLGQVIEVDGVVTGPAAAEQDGLRQLLYTARALLGELRVEEQHWNQETQEEKARRKELAEMAKG